MARRQPDRCFRARLVGVRFGVAHFVRSGPADSLQAEDVAVCGVGDDDEVAFGLRFGVAGGEDGVVVVLGRVESCEGDGEGGGGSVGDRDAELGELREGFEGFAVGWDGEGEVFEGGVDFGAGSCGCGDDGGWFGGGF